MTGITSLTALFYSQQTQAASSKKQDTSVSSTDGTQCAQGNYGAAAMLTLSNAAQSILGGGTQQIGDTITPDPISDNAFGYTAGASAGNGNNTFELLMATFSSGGSSSSSTGSTDGVTNASATSGSGASSLQDIFQEVQDLFAMMQSQFQGGGQSAQATQPSTDDSTQQASIDPQQTGLGQHHHHHHHGGQPPAAAVDPSAGTSTGTDSNTQASSSDAASILDV